METFYKMLFLTGAIFALVYSEDGFTTINKGDLVLDVSDYELPWVEAASKCRSINKTLLSIESPAKDRVLVDMFVNGGSNFSLPGNNSWISATELNTREGVWTWDSLDNEPMFYTRWMVGQPDDLTSLNCAYLAIKNLHYWRDANCSAPMYFICESEATDPPGPALAPNNGNSFGISWSTFLLGIATMYFVDF